MDTETVPETPPADLDLIAEIDRFASLLRGEEPAGTEAETLARITAFEELKATIVSAQSAEAVAFEVLRQRRDALNQVPARECGIRSAEEIALAKKVSPGSGRRFLSTSRAIVCEMPNTFKALASGEISEDKARVMADETATLPSADRRKVDTRMKMSMGPAGIRSLRTEARALAEEMNAEAAAERAERAIANRRVTMTALDDGMGRVSAVLPIQQAVAVYEGLMGAAESVAAAGGAKGRRNNQLMADTFVERLTGQSSAADVPTEVHLVVEAETLLSDGMVPAWLPGFGPLPARTARSFLAANEAEVFIRRMFTRATDGQLVGMESRGRVFTGQLRQMVIYRDDVCRTPWCDARIRHADHADGYASGGATSWENGSGLCAACNYAKEHPGWKHEATAEGLKVTTPSGSEYEDATAPFVRRMKYPRAAPRTGDPPETADREDDGISRSSPRDDDWRLKLSGLLEPERPGAPPDPESREVEIPFLPITGSEAKKYEESQRSEPTPGELPECEIVELVEPVLLPRTIRPTYRRRKHSSSRNRGSRWPDDSEDSCVERCLRQVLLDAG